MACCARIESGTVTVSLTPEPGDGAGAKPTRFDRSIVSVVVIGGGIAGVTAADFIRRGHPDCEIHLVGQESHALYNRMGISRLVYGRSAMQGLYLLPEQWYDDHGVYAWLNTVAQRIDIRGQRVLLGTGDRLPYDRLILAMGSQRVAARRSTAWIARQLRSSRGLRRDAATRVRPATPLPRGGGGGRRAARPRSRLLAASARGGVTVLERGNRLLSKQIDPRCSEVVENHFAKAGVAVLKQAETARVVGSPAVSGVVLKDRPPCAVPGLHGGDRNPPQHRPCP